jgi:hypothetical protein
MTKELHERCNSMALDLGYTDGWDNLTVSLRVPVMQLVQLSFISTQLGFLDLSLRSRSQS